MRFGVRELKANLSHILALAQTGEDIEITSHRKPVARIVGVPAAADQGLRQLMQSHTVTWNGKKPQFVAPQTVSSSGKPVSRLVMEDRG